MNVCTVNKINMEKIICIGFFLVLLALGSQSAEIQGNIVRNLLNAASKNETKRVNMYNQILKQEVKNEEKIFGTFKNELEDTKRANLRRKAERMFKRQASPDVPSNNPCDNIKDLRDELKMEEIPGNFAYNAGLNKAAALLLPVISSLRREFGPVLGYAKDRYCARKLRSFIEFVQVRNVGFYIEDKKRQNALGSELGIVWKNREMTLRSVLVILASVMKSVQDNPKDEICIEKAKQDFKTLLKRLHKLDLSLPDGKPGFYKDELIKEIAFLNKNENWDESSIWELWKEEHKDFWFQKSTIWQSEKDLNDRDDALIVQKLTRNVTVEKTTMNFQTWKEFAYLKAIVRGNVEGLQMSNQAEVCLWITIIHPESWFSRVVEEVSTNSEVWKKLDDAGKRLRFCAAYGKFYNKLSVFDPHRDAPALPSACRVGSKDYMKFFEQISEGSPDLSAVGNAFIKLMGIDTGTLFEKQTTVKPQ